MAAMTQPNRDLMRINPLGKIPALITDDGKVLFDSTVIGAFDRAGRRIASRHDNSATG
jgi:glutathione S-transferase